MNVTVAPVTGASLAEVIPALARLRIAVFRAFPYLYDGDAAYEADYLADFAAAEGAVVVVARDGDTIVGAATAAPLAAQDEAWRAPLAAAGFDVARCFYFGESVLLADYRGRGIGHAFFDRREAHARGRGRFRWTAFCAVDREPDDPRRPAGYRPNDAFWHKRGYARQPGMTMRLPWNEHGRGEVGHALTFWLRDWSEEAA